MVAVRACLSCAALDGTHPPPGGVLIEDAHWAFFLRIDPPLIPGQGFVVLRRHAEHLNDLDASELQALGTMLARVEATLTRTLGAERVHFGLYGEQVRHVHLHVLPRTEALPAGNIPATLLTQWRMALRSLGLWRGFSDADVLAVAERIRQV